MLSRRIGLMQVAIYSRGQRKVYAFDRAFDGGCSQEQVYRDTKSLIRSVLDGEAAAHMWLVTVQVEDVSSCKTVSVRTCKWIWAADRGCPAQARQLLHQRKIVVADYLSEPAQGTTCASSPTARRGPARRTRCWARTSRAPRGAASTSALSRTCSNSVASAKTRRALCKAVKSLTAHVLPFVCCTSSTLHAAPDAGPG